MALVKASGIAEFCVVKYDGISGVFGVLFIFKVEFITEIFIVKSDVNAEELSAVVIE